MINKTVTLEATPEEVAELLFNLDNQQVAKVFSLWKQKFDEEYDRRVAAKETIWIFDLNHFMMHVVDELDDDGLDFIRSSYSSMLYRLLGDVSKKHLLKLVR